MTDCIICGSSDFESLYNNSLKRCRSCAFVTANLEINETILKSTYNINYFKGAEYLDYMQDKEILQLNFEKRIPLIKKTLKSGPPISNCFEIGCAYGFFGEVVLKHFGADFYGIDVVSEAIDYAKEQLHLKVQAGDYLEQPEPSTAWSDVFMWDVIEHLKDPQFYLQKAHRELLPGGRIYITTGDIGALLPSLQGRNWRMIHPPSHIHYFSRKTLEMLLKKSGFKVVHTTYLPVYRSIRQIYYSLFLLRKSGKISSKLFNLIPSQWHIPVNTFDIVFMIAIKE